ncbi:MAG: hypothetical protein NVSMB14_05920 [Isosphaeraceae bacterium]
MPTTFNRPSRARFVWLSFFLLAPFFFSGCGGPSPREVQNRRELEALLTAVSLRNKPELETDAKRIDARRSSGELSEDAYQSLQSILSTARSGDWAGAEKQAYEFRERKPYFR